jgi:hypothetical protein
MARLSGEESERSGGTRNADTMSATHVTCAPSVTTRSTDHSGHQCVERDARTLRIVVRRDRYAGEMSVGRRRDEYVTSEWRDTRYET